MTREENIRAILECNFSGTKEELIDIAVKNIMALSQEPTDKPMCDRNICISNEYNGIGRRENRLLDKIRAEIERLHYHPKIDFIKNDEVVETALEIIDKYKVESEYE